VEEIRGVAAGQPIQFEDQGPKQDPDSREEQAGRDVAREAYKHAIDWQKRPGPVYHAEQILTAPVITVSADMLAGEVWKLLRKNKIRHLPILSKQDKLIGMVSTNDFLDLTFPSGPFMPTPIPSKPISAFMVTPVITAGPLTDIRRIAHLLFEKHIGSMPILSDTGDILGIVTRSDILKALINHPELSIWA
jgi:CBS domain-containing protein